MGYDFEISFDSLYIKDKSELPSFIQELRDCEGTSWLPDEIKPLDYEYYNFKKDEYPNCERIDIVHECCPKFHNIESWLEIFNKYCIGEIEIKGRDVWMEVEFEGKGDFEEKFFCESIVEIDSDYADCIDEGFMERLNE